MSVHIPAKPTTAFFNRRNLLVTTTISVGYLLLSALLVGFKTDQLWLVAIFNGCYYASRISRKFILGFSVFVIYWILFDYQKALPNYMVSPVHIKDLYDAEKSLFGIMMDGVKLTPNEFWMHHKNALLDVLTGVFYLCWVPVPLAFACYMFFKDRLAFLHFICTFLFVNFIGWIGYYTYPAAPPWYVQLHGFDFQANTPGHIAGLIGFDNYFQVTVFQSLYAKGSNVFAAMPSLHSAYPLIVFFYARKHTHPVFITLFGIITAGIWFAAVYTSHHYVLDVAAGIFCALIGYLLYKRVLMKTGWYSRFIERFYAAIA